MDLSVCIVNWNTRDLLRDCLASLYATVEHHSFEVTVVDNASADGSAAMVAEQFPQVRLIANRENKGFARGNNQALVLSRGRYIMILNPDTVALPGTFDSMTEYMDAHPGIGALSPRLVFPGGAPQTSCLAFPTLFTEFADLSGLARRYPRSRIWARYTMAGWDHSDTREVDQPMGTCLLVRREVVEQVGLLDERFPLYYNDVDWCRRIKRAGWSIVFNADAVLVHNRAASGNQLGLRYWVEIHRGKCWYFRKRYGWWRYPAFWLLNVSFVGCRYLRQRWRYQFNRWCGRWMTIPELARNSMILKVYLNPRHLQLQWQPPETETDAQPAGVKQ